MADYNRQNFSNMKNEAVRNAREMHKRTADSPEKKNSDNNKTDDVGTSSAQNFQQSANGNSGGILRIADSFFENIGISKSKLDSDKIIVILMIIMLAREGADLKLLLALGYIIM